MSLEQQKIPATKVLRIKLIMKQVPTSVKLILN